MAESEHEYDHNSTGKVESDESLETSIYIYIYIYILNKSLCIFLELLNNLRQSSVFVHSQPEQHSLRVFTNFINTSI